MLLAIDVCYVQHIQQELDFVWCCYPNVSRSVELSLCGGFERSVTDDKLSNCVGTRPTFLIKLQLSITWRAVGDQHVHRTGTRKLARSTFTGPSCLRSRSGTPPSLSRIFVLLSSLPPGSITDATQRRDDSATYVSFPWQLTPPSSFSGRVLHSPSSSVAGRGLSLLSVCVQQPRALYQLMPPVPCSPSRARCPLFLRCAPEST